VRRLLRVLIEGHCRVWCGVVWCCDAWDRYWRVVALAAQYRRWRLLYNQFHSWAFRAKHRREFKDRKRIERKVQRHAESNRREAEEKAQKKAEEAAKRAAKEAAAKEEAWKEKLKKAEACVCTIALFVVLRRVWWWLRPV